MSEPKRVPLQTLDLPDSLGHTTKKADKAKQLAPSFRFELTLPESNEQTCPEYNYAQLLRAAEKKRKKESKGKEEVNTNGLDPFASDDEDQLKEMARRFEAKYGTTNSSKRKRHKYDDYVDLGAGYDENDSFIDNTDAYDEIVPEEVTTAHGGFYINSGALEFKQAEGVSAVNNNNDNNDNDNEDDDESSEEEAEDADSPKRSKRDNSSSESEELDQPFKKTKLDESIDKKLNHDSLAKKKQNHSAEFSNKRKNDDKDSSENNHDDTDSKSKKFKVDGSKKFDVKKFIKPSSTNGVDAKKIEYKKADKVDASIESVVNAARVDDESSRDTFDSGKSRGPPVSDSECEDTDKGELRVGLPEGLPESVKDAVNKLKNHRESIKKKNKSFPDSINSELLSLEKKLRMLNLPTVKLQVYEHLAPYFMCSRGTLISRTKKLSVQDAENRVKDPVQRLKSILGEMMPTILEKYDKECQRVAQEKNVENQSIDLENNDRNGNSQLNDIMPRKLFPWTEETKKLIHDIANAQKSYYKIAKPRKQSVEEFVTSYLKTEVLTLWPSGWMNMPTLLKYANLDSTCKKKQKPKEPNAPAPVTHSAQNCNSRLEVSSNSNYTPELPAVNKVKNSVPSSLEITKVEPMKIDAVPAPMLNPIKNSLSTEIKPVTIKYKEKPEASNHAVTSKPQNQMQPNDWADYSEHSKKIMAQFALDLPTIKHDLSITPVNDYQKITSKSEVKKDVVSITPYNEPSQNSHFVPTSSNRLEPMDLKNHLDEVEQLEMFKAEKRKQKKRERYMENRYKEMREEQSKEHNNPLMPQLSKEEQEQRQIEETMAATNVLSQLINDCPVQTVGDQETNAEPATDTEKEVQEVHDVMKSLKELEKLRERSSPSHSPMRAPQNTGIYLSNYQNDYHRFFQKKDDKMKLHKKEGHW